MIRIFHADDDEDDTMFFKEAIAKIVQNANIICASNGEELLQNLKDKVPPPPTFLFLDLNMPVKTGHDCLKEIKDNPFYKDIKVVILTTTQSQAEIDKTYQNGADYYICKPTSMKGYENALKKLFAYKFAARSTKETFVIN